MLPPEIQRVVLLVGLAATAYLMILAWNDDMQAQQTPVTYSEAPLSSNAANTANSNGISGTNSDTPVLLPSENPTTVNSDVPDVSLLADNNAPAQPLAVPGAVNGTQNRSNLVMVNTPNLKIWIDLVGGDIVRVQLPKYPVDIEHKDVPFQLLEKSATHTYIAQSGLIGTDGPDSQPQRPFFSTSNLEVDVAEGQTFDLVLQANVNNGNAILKKIYTIRGDDYLLDVKYTLQNLSSAPMSAGMFAQIKRDTQEPVGSDTFSLGPQPYLGAAYTSPEDNYVKLDFEDIDDDGPVTITVEGGWIAFLQHYFISAWVAPVEQNNRFYARRGSDGKYLFGFTGPAISVAAGATGEWQAQFYAGPKDQKRMEEIAPHLYLTVDYGFLWWIAVPLFYLLDWLHDLVGNWGFAIILLTVIVKALLYPLSAAGYRSMANMRRVAPAMKKLQERYANDREKLSREMMALYKKEGANPLGGCFPMLLPMPIFLALYWVLFESVELRQAPFILWIEDLAIMDPFFILPLAMGASMYWMQTLNPQMGDPMQVKMMKMMPVMFTVLFLFFPAGLVLYWLVNNILSVAQQQYVYKQADRALGTKT